MMITEKDIISFLQHEKKIHDRVDEVMAIIHSASPIRNYDGSFNITGIDEKSIETEWTVYSNCSCCSDETFGFCLPTNLLHENDDVIKKKFILEKEAKEAKEKQKEMDKKLKIEADKKEKKQQKLNELLAEKDRESSK